MPPSPSPNWRWSPWLWRGQHRQFELVAEPRPNWRWSPWLWRGQHRQFEGAR